MNSDQRAALERLLEYVGRGFCAVQADCRMLREFLADPAHAQVDSLISALGRARELNGGVIPEPRPLELTHLLAGGKTLVCTFERLADIGVKKEDLAYKRSLAKQRVAKTKKQATKKPTPKPSKR